MEPTIAEIVAEILDASPSIDYADLVMAADITCRLDDVCDDSYEVRCAIDTMIKEGDVKIVPVVDWVDCDYRQEM